MLVSRRQSRRLGTAIALNLAALLLLAAWLLAQAYPATEAVRLRNALLLEAGAPPDFDWTPARMPAGFMAEQRAPTPQFVSAARAAGADPSAGDWERALALAAALTRNAQDKGAIQGDLESTHRAIVEDGRGYCADFTAVYLALAHAAGLAAREWGFSFDGFGGHGHAVVEIFDRRRGKWAFLDVFNNVHAVDAVSREPLSALEFRDFVLGRRPAPVILPNGPGRLGYPLQDKLIAYYSRGAQEWYLSMGNNVYSYEAHPAVRAAGRISRSLEQLAAVAVGVHPRLLALASPENAPQLERMARLRVTLIALAALGAVLLLTLAALLGVLFARRFGAHRRATAPPGLA